MYGSCMRPRMRETFNQFHRVDKTAWQSYIKFSFHTILKSCFIELKLSERERGVFVDDTLMKDLYILVALSTNIPFNLFNT